MDDESKQYKTSEEGRKKARERMAANRKTPEYREYITKKVRSAPHRFRMAKKVAKEKDLTFGIDFPWYEAFIKNPCYYCNRSLKDEAGYSLDRIDNNIGYVVDNLRPCCGDCNKRRGPRSYQEYELEVKVKGIRIPNPGTVEAVMQRCICSVVDNDYGDAVEFKYDSKCKLHQHLL